MNHKILAFIFDLDGIIVNTTNYHYLSWKKLSQSFNFNFREKDNELLKGANRTTSLNILLKLAGLELTPSEKNFLLEKKNEIYLDLIKHMTVNDTLPGVINFIEKAKSNTLKTGLASSSKNAIATVRRLHIDVLFDKMLDANTVIKGKPDPKVYREIAKSLQVETNHCVVFEDAANGIEAARKAGMWVVGMGAPEQIKDAHMTISSFLDVEPKDIIDFFRNSGL
ncbi:MAG: beta-phosphoglucomutase [Saprospiraceae bacterium]|nr:beta-phosphoglucomutase [Saprospiraceae bacterium]